MSSSTNGRKPTLHQSRGKSFSCDYIRASSCIELADIRKLDSLLNQCESISCDNLLLYDEVYNYDVCSTSKRKYLSTSALHKILPKNSIRRRTHKKVLSIRENDTKIIKLIDDKRQRDDPAGYAAAEKLTNSESIRYSCSDLMQHQPIVCRDRSSHSDLEFCKQSSSQVLCNNQSHLKQVKRKNSKRKQCSCRDYETIDLIRETSLTTPPKKCSRRFTNSMTFSDDECSSNVNNFERCKENIVINLNDASKDIFPTPLNSSYSPNTAMVGGECETQSQKSKRSKFSPSFISRKLTSRLNSSEDDGAWGVKESLLGRSSKSVEKKLLEPVETVCTFGSLSVQIHSSFFYPYLIFSDTINFKFKEKKVKKVSLR